MVLKVNLHYLGTILIFTLSSRRFMLTIPILVSNTWLLKVIAQIWVSPISKQWQELKIRGEAEHFFKGELNLGDFFLQFQTLLHGVKFLCIWFMNYKWVTFFMMFSDIQGGCRLHLDHFHLTNTNITIILTSTAKWHYNHICSQVDNVDLRSR